MLYGVISYFLFFGIFVYFIAFVGDVFVPKKISSEAGMDATNALVINLGLMLLWGIQHSVMARSWFKNAIAKLVPHHIERSTYVLATVIVLAVLMYFWQPIEGVIWQVDDPLWQKVVWAGFGVGWVLVLISSFLTDHFDLFGLRQTWIHFVKKSYTAVKFSERLVYRWIRHPMMLGLLIGFWAVPVMTVGHLVFSMGMSAYVLVGIYFEENALAKSFGSPYVDYQRRTARLVPRIY
jgi:protein-S-isoprenylcysteine O-methyltransferase Ste14